MNRCPCYLSATAHLDPTGSKALCRFKIENFKRMLRHLHGELNLDEIKKLIAHVACKLRDEYNEPK